MNLRSKTIFCLLLTLTITALAQMNVSLKLSGTIQRDDKSLDVKDVQLMSGEIITWSIEAINSDSAPATDFAPTAKIPAGTEYVPYSATGASKIEFSIDGGRTYAGKPMIRERGPDGQEHEVEAKPSLFTNVKFVHGTLSPGTVKLIYQTKVR